MALGHGELTSNSVPLKKLQKSGSVSGTFHPQNHQRPGFATGRMLLWRRRDLLIEELRDLYSAETQLVAALPKVAQTAASNELE